MCLSISHIHKRIVHIGLVSINGTNVNQCEEMKKKIPSNRFKAVLYRSLIAVLGQGEKINYRCTYNRKQGQ